MWWDFLTTLFDTDWFFNLLEKSPAQLVVYTLVIFALGAAAGIRAGKKARDELESKINEREHEITRLTTQLEGERTRVTQVMRELAEEVSRRVVREEIRPVPSEEFKRLL